MEFLDLDNLPQMQKAFSATQCDFLLENCIVAMENNNHTTGCPLFISGDNNIELIVKWNRGFLRNGYKEQTKIVEHAAEAISFFLSAKLTKYKVVEEALIGTGIDYWLGYDEEDNNYDPQNFIQARLEISGIGRESENNTLRNRVKIKMKQTAPTDESKLPAFVSVVEFSTPKAFFGRK
jgi:hypothetical protein